MVISRVWRAQSVNYYTLVQVVTVLILLALAVVGAGVVFVTG
ncbi:MAG: hypothetical protein A07HB70_02006 [uncultured archaeon A07HB70]|nr:MAG: hypothetical protein A07HB70_02006 [uncultured archaeon A07HB70]